MKKNIFLLIISLITFTSFGQDAADKKYQAGLVAGFGLNIQKMGTKLMEANGMGHDLTVGANLNVSFTETIGLCTGIEFDFSTLKYKSAGTNVYYNYFDNTIYSKAETAAASSSELYRLSEREQKPVYLTIPTMILFRTKFIGYFRYFGKFGLRNSFMLTNKIYDTGFNYDPDVVIGAETAANNENMTASGDMFFFKSAVGLAGGAEWNFTGATSLVAEVGYYYGVTPLHLNRKEDKSFLYTSGLNNGSGNDIYFSNQATQSQIMFKVSVLF